MNVLTYLSAKGELAQRRARVWKPDEPPLSGRLGAKSECHPKLHVSLPMLPNVTALRGLKLKSPLINHMCWSVLSSEERTASAGGTTAERGLGTVRIA